MPRLHEEELAGYLLEACGWHHLSLPALSETDLEIAIGQGQIEHFLEGSEGDSPPRLIDHTTLSRVDCTFAETRERQDPKVHAPMPEALQGWAEQIERPYINLYRV